MDNFRPLPRVNKILADYQDQLFVLGDNENSDLLIYDPETGIFKPGERQVKLSAKELLGPIVRHNRVNEVFKLVHLAAPRKSPGEFDADRNIITFANGVLKVRRRQLVPFSPEFLCRTRIPRKHLPNATCPKINNFLSEVVDPEYHPLIEEILGCVLTGDVRFEACPLLIGPGADGKSVLSKVAEAMVGSENTTNVPLQELADNGFYRAELRGKRLNIFADIDQVSPNKLGILKALISGDPILAARKFKDPFSFSNSAVLIFSCNQLPDFHELTYAVQRRFIVIPFPNIFKGAAADKELVDKLTKPRELAGLTNRALRGYRRLLRQGDFSIPEESRKLLRLHFESSDSVAVFLKEHTYDIPDARVSKSGLYTEYRQQCDGNYGGLGVKPVSRTKFNAGLRQLRPSVREGKMSTADRRDAWIGLSLHPGESRIPSVDDPQLNACIH